jgi:hypothetical protein
MGKLVSQLVFCAIFPVAMFAQSSTGNSSGQTSGSSASSSSDSSQPYQSSTGNQSSANNTAGGQQSSIEGCIFERRTADYVQPVNGGPPTQLAAGNQDLASHVGQDVRLSGTMNNGTSASNSSSGSTGSVAGSQDQGQVLLVTRVDEVAKRCPADTQRQIDQGNSGSASPQ